MRESKIETAVCNYAKSKGWLVYKFTSPSRRAVPDRIFLRGGVVFFIEFKATGKELRKQQEKIREKFLSHGISVYKVDDINIGKKIIDNMGNEDVK